MSRDTRSVRAGWRQIDDLAAGHDAAANMAADLALVDDVGGGAAPALRFYRWGRPALSLGRFQPASDVDEMACRERGVEVVRRPTGGRALLHGGDLTYAAVFPRPRGAAGAVDTLYRWLAEGLCSGLAHLGVEAGVAAHRGDAGPACFSSHRGADLRVGGRKLVGSAQVHRNGVVLQHGSVLLERLAFDESDLLALDERAETREMLRTTTITMEELGATVDAGVVADALARGFAEALDLDFRSSLFVAAPGARR